MEQRIGQDFAFAVTIETLARRLRLENDPADEDFQRASAMLAEALACARPKFAYAVAAITEKGDGYVIVEGQRLDSPLVRRNLDQVHRIVPYVATCGTEAEDWSRQYTDMLENYWADQIKNLILIEAVTELRRTVQSRYFPDSRLAGDHSADHPAEYADGQPAVPAGEMTAAAHPGEQPAVNPANHPAVRPGDMAKMSPGSLPEWPVSQQPALFALLDGLPGAIGIRLTDSCLMLPSKSVSGFFFSSESSFVNCRFCPILDCPNRSARFQADARP